MSTNEFGVRRESIGKEQSDMLRRVRLLLNQAENAAATPEEAEAFSRKAEHLITKYALDIALLEEEEGHGAPTMRRLPAPAPYPKPKATLINGIAKAFNCKAVWDSREAVVEVIGYENDLEMVALLYGSLSLQATSAMLHQSRSDRAFRTSFWYGFVNRVAERLRETYAKAEREVAEERASSEGKSQISTSLVLRERKKEVDEAFRERHPSTRSTRGRASNQYGYGSGQQAGDRADVGGHRLRGSHGKMIG